METEKKSNSAKHEMAEDMLITIRRIIQAIDMHSRQLVKAHGLTVLQLVILKPVEKQKKLSTKC